MEWKPIKIVKQVNIDALYSLFIEKKPEGFDFSGETHNFWECRYIISGTALVSADEKIYELSKGDIIFHKPMEMHKLSVNGKKGAHILIFSFNLKGKYADYFNDKVFHLTEEQQDIIELFLEFIKSNEDDLMKNYKKEEQFLYAKKDNPLYLQQVVTHLEHLLLSLADSPNISKVSTSKDALIFKDVIKYMNDNVFNHPTVSDIAKSCYLSQSGLKRLFEKYAGISIHKYFLKLKFKVATKMLKDGMSVSEVSEKLNFSSQSYFSVSYKREMGISPSEI